MTFKKKPLGTISTGIDWNSIAKRVADELGCDYALTFLYANPNPPSALHPLARQRVRFAYEKLGAGAALPVLSFFGTREDAEAIAATIAANEFGSTRPEDDWDWIVDDNDIPIRVASHRKDRIAFAVNAYAASRERVQSASAQAQYDDNDDDEVFDDDEEFLID